jgi:hypothetical protein
MSDIDYQVVAFVRHLRKSFQYYLLCVFPTRRVRNVQQLAARTRRCAPLLDVLHTRDQYISPGRILISGKIIQPCRSADQRARRSSGENSQDKGIA